jgi:hypothetical protein
MASRGLGARRRAEVAAWREATQRRRVEAFVRSQQERRQARDRLARDSGLYVVELPSLAEEMNATWPTR